MTTKEKAYKIIKERSDFPITYILETDRYFASTADTYLLINKSSGDIEDHLTAPDYLIIAVEGKYVLLNCMFEDFLAYCKEHSGDDKTLAKLFAAAWNQFFYHQEEGQEKFSSETEREQILAGWSEIEQLLYEEIRRRMDPESQEYPPCVQDHCGDPFYMAKPFMLKNGWTTNDVSRTYVRD